LGNLKNRLPVALLLVLLVAVVALNAFWVMRDTDEMYRTEQPKFITVRSFVDPGFSYEPTSYFPPAYFWMCAQAVSLLQAPLSYDLCVLVNLLYLVLSLAGMFLLGRHLTKSAAGGLAAALLLPALPVYLHISRRFICEFALTTGAIWAVYLLVSNPGWQDRRRAWLFGAVCGLGMLFKWTFIVYIIAPSLVSLGHVFLAGPRPEKKKALLHLLSALLAAFLVCGYWYVLRLDLARLTHDYASNLADAQGISLSYPLFLRENVWLLVRTLDAGVSSALLLIVLPALVVVLRRSWRRTDCVLLLSWLMFAPLFFTCCVGEIMPRYLLPVLPALVLFVVLAAFPGGGRKNVPYLAALALFSLALIGYESFVHRPPRTYSPVKFDAALQSVLQEEGGRRIVFMGINDEVTEREVLDLYNLFWVRDIENMLGLDLVYVTTAQQLSENIGARFLFSQDTAENSPWHLYLKGSGYVLVDRFAHHYRENTDPIHDWVTHGDYLLFRKEGP